MSEGPDNHIAEVVSEGVQSLKQMEDLRQEQHRAMSQISDMVRWYGKKSKRFKDLVLWERVVRIPSRGPDRPLHDRTIPAAAPQIDDPPEMDLLCKHRDHHDRLEKTLEAMDVQMQGLEGKDYTGACLTYSRLADRMLGHLKEIGVILGTVSKELLQRESTMQRMSTEIARLSIWNAQHNDRISMMTEEQNPDRMTNADLNKILADHARKSEQDAGVNNSDGPHDEEAQAS